MTTALRTQKTMFFYDDNGKKLNLDKLLEGASKSIWENLLDNELGRLSNGLPQKLLGTKTIAFIFKHEIPQGRKITYANMVCDFRPLRTEKYRVRLTIGGDKLIYDSETASPAASLLETKILLNSIISNSKQGARFMTIDIKDFFLQSKLKIKEYMKFHSKYFSKRFRDIYKLHDKINGDGYVYCAIQKGMYGLKQAAILAYKQLVEHLKTFGYEPIEGTTGIWGHVSRPIRFALCVDDFGVKYYRRDDVHHIINALKSAYEISIDWSSEAFCGLNIKWMYKSGYVDIGMPHYIEKALQKNQHTKPYK